MIKKQLMTINVAKIVLVLLLTTTVSCSKEDADLKDLTTQESTELPLNPSETLTGATNCNVPTPTTTTGVNDQVCTDISNPWNKGKLDCRTNTGGYSQSGGRGVYNIKGSSTRYGGTKARVERFFKTFSRSANRSAKFTTTFRIEDLSDAQTYIAQAHGGGEIKAGKKKGKIAKSASFLVRARKKSGSTTKYLIDMEYPYDPWYSEPNSSTTNSGTRRFKGEFEINKNQDYKMEVTTGYNGSQKATSMVKFFSGSTLIKAISLNHTYTSETTYVRYGAYSANDTGDQTARVKHTSTTYCLTN